MFRSVTPGKAIAFFLSLALVFCVWGLVFVPGGLGSNIVLGMILAGAAVYYMTLRLGPWIDDMWFHGGSRQRALLVRRAEHLAEETKTLLQTASKKKFGQEQLAGYERALAAMETAAVDARAKWSRDSGLIATQISIMARAIENTETAFEKLVGGASKHRWFSGARSLIVALLLALALRAFIVEPFQIPSGSMIPALLVGDHLFVSKLRYGLVNPFSRDPSYFYLWDKPKAGEVIVFQAPSYVGNNAGQPWIKRVIAGPGQTVKVSDSIVYVDGKPYPQVMTPERVTYMDYFPDDEGPSWREREAIHTKEKIDDLEHDIYLRPSGEVFAFDKDWPSFVPRKLPGLKCTVEECTVEEGHLFVMGDNRGNSADSRVWGGLPIQAVKGKAFVIWMSVDGSQRSVELGRFTLPLFRWQRWFSLIH